METKQMTMTTKTTALSKPLFDSYQPYIEYAVSFPSYEYKLLFSYLIHT